MDEVASETVWNREIYQGFINLLHELFGNQLEVYVRKNDDDFKLEKFPCVLLQITDYKFATDRYYKKQVYVQSKDYEAYKGIIESPPLTFDIALQMDFYTDSQEEMDVLSIDFINAFQRDFNLDVENRGGKKDNIHVMPENLQGGPKRLDEVDGADRLFRLCFKFLAYGRIFEHKDMEEVPLAKEFTFHTRNDYRKGD